MVILKHWYQSSSLNSPLGTVINSKTVLSVTNMESPPASATPTFSMKMTIQGIKAKFPRVKNLSTEDVFNALSENKQNSNRELLLLDARPEEEHVVSHIAGSIRVSPDAADIQDITAKIAQYNGPVDVVCYCSLGYRSCFYADAIMKVIHSKDNKDATATSSEDIQIYNLEGSLFKWANEGKPMIDKNGQPTKYVHPYNALFGKLLKHDLRKDTLE